MTTDTAEEIAALRRELTLIWSAHEREHSQHETAHAREHKFAQDAIDKAAELAKQNKIDGNEWRATMTDRESRFATKEDVTTILKRLDSIERADLVAAERERQRIIDDAEDKRQAEIRLTEERRQSERRTSRAQWTIGLVVAFVSTFGAILVSLVLRLAFPS